MRSGKAFTVEYRTFRLEAENTEIELRRSMRLLWSLDTFLHAEQDMLLKLNNSFKIFHLPDVDYFRRSVTDAVDP